MGMRYRLENLQKLMHMLKLVKMIHVIIFEECNHFVIFILNAVPLPVSKKIYVKLN